MNIESLQLQTADIESVHAFYGERFGLPVSFDNSSEQLSVTVGISKLVFQQTDGFAGRYHFAFNVPENRIRAARDFLQMRNIPLIEDARGKTLFDFDFWDAHTVYFYDSAGNIAEFIARHELPNTFSKGDAAAFSASEILNISEIALPSADIPALAALIRKNGDIADYRETSQTFMPLGDANGLFILVPIGRVWYPDTGIPAEAFPIQATIKTDVGSRYTVTGLPYTIVLNED